MIRGMRRMKDELLQLLTLLEKDEVFANQMKICKSEDEAYSLAADKVKGFTKEEFKGLMKKVQASQNNELSDEDLSGVAGGLSEGEWVALGSLGISTAAAAASAV